MSQTKTLQDRVNALEIQAMQLENRVAMLEEERVQ